jgi:hypothetical protein
MTKRPLSFRNNFRRRARLERQRLQRPPIKKQAEESPVTGKMILRLLLMIVTAGIMGRT